MQFIWHIADQKLPEDNQFVWAWGAGSPDTVVCALFRDTEGPARFEVTTGPVTNVFPATAGIVHLWMPIIRPNPPAKHIAQQFSPPKNVKEEGVVRGAHEIDTPLDEDGNPIVQ